MTWMSLQVIIIRWYLLSTVGGEVLLVCDWLPLPTEAYLIWCEKMPKHNYVIKIETGEHFSGFFRILCSSIATLKDELINKNNYHSNCGERNELMLLAWPCRIHQSSFVTVISTAKIWQWTTLNQSLHIRRGVGSHPVFSSSVLTGLQSLQYRAPVGPHGRKKMDVEICGKGLVNFARFCTFCKCCPLLIDQHSTVTDSCIFLHGVGYQ